VICYHGRVPALALALILQQAPGGVFVDPDGVLRHRASGEGARLKALREAARRQKGAGPLVYVSLPRLLAEARRGPSAEVATLSGMTKLRYVFVFPEEHDLVVAGPAEEVVEDFPGRPVGRRTGRPVLQLEDLVTALKIAGPGGDGGPFGCSIEPTAEGAERMARKTEEFKEVVRKEPRRRREVYDAVAAAGGLQAARIFGVPGNTRAAFVCLEADYLMKRHSLGLDPTPVKAAASLLDLVTTRVSGQDRLWFEAAYEPLRVSADGRAFELAGPSIRVRARGLAKGGAEEEPDAAGRAYAERLSRHMEALCREIPAWADLANVADLALVAALVRLEGLHEKAGWDVARALEGLPVAERRAATSVDTLINFREAGNFLVVVSGGVSLSLDEAARARREAGDADPAREARRPEAGWSVRRER
jgi:hypothetical protein